MAMTPVAWKLVLFEFMVFLLLNFVPLQPIAATQKEMCSYTLEVRTKRKLPFLDDPGTKDPVHVKLQDRNGGDVTKKHLNEKNPEKFFNPGKTDSFNFDGPCLKGNVCLLNFMVDGENGWKPRNATVSGKNLSVPYTFYFGSTLPAKAWHGPNLCSINEQVASTMAEEYKYDDEEDDEVDDEAEKKNKRRCLKSKQPGKGGGC
ncbi:uncharacterized protein LOC131054717 [Cryptomeria japonica]|uniref:uncharacterized protein LOC131054717 n=1 Tax=Cryptomeria japonica TaxID=3369 RepID=UPI0027DA8988|nr:uncharacterized protein LOC131054717 [Cryptomeria japonica]XP_057845271.2 uncharacterized protein LOC131054717 [Cryptomeria japonica]XP_057845273.2 uncharacterized protein LOC131054717 [Cryptomeria japonica]